MAMRSVRPAAVIDGFTIGECLHPGGMATLWSVTAPTHSSQTSCPKTFTIADLSASSA
ncbi:MAG: eukaryotic-like serine/threonine-protein kinase [Bradyrhizobium sp.]|jgi:hypothetical protein|nr:eukaryotic-like serine/threonine-protein kinase [Bradyrhizobium sp.]